MSKRCVLLTAVVLALTMVSAAAAQPATKGPKKPRFFNPFLPRYSRLQVTPFGFPQFQTTGTGSTVLVSRPVLSTPATAAPVVTATAPAITSASPVVTAAPVVTVPVVADAGPVTASAAAAATAGASVADLSETDGNIPQTVVTRPPFRPPVRSPYRPPPRPPF